jgi:uncharacterized protein (TIGR02265 family)
VRFAGLTQLVECQLPKLDVAGSNPVSRSEIPDMAIEALPTTWSEPPWQSPLDVNSHLDAIPPGATISGVFLSSLFEMAQARGVKLAPRRDRYLPFRRYPLREHAELLVEASSACWPREPLRQGLRRIGRGSPKALVQSMLGRIVLGSVEGPGDVVRAMARSYPMHMEPGRVEVIELARGELVVRLRDITYFLDCHHVGVFEGVLRHAGVLGDVTIHSHSVKDADLLLRFRAPTPASR